MKINERTLISYSTSTASPTDKQGWLYKRGEVNKGFQRRYFVLKGNLLFYFDKRQDKEPVGVVILEGCTVELAEEEQEKFAFKVAFHGEGKRTYVLGTDTQDVMEDWMKTLACSSYDYMKLMVLELQQQLQELEEAERTAASALPASSSNGGLSLAASDSGEPKAPPRQNRANPFNASNASSQQPEGGKKAPKKSWLLLHHELGDLIVRDRMDWVKRVELEQKEDGQI